MLLILTLGESAIPKKGEWWKNWAMGMVPQLPKSLEKMQLLKRLLKYPNMERGSARSAKRTNKEKRDLIKGSHRTPSCDWFRKALRLGMMHLLAAWKPLDLDVWCSPWKTSLLALSSIFLMSPYRLWRRIWPQESKVYHDISWVSTIVTC